MLVTLSHHNPVPRLSISYLIQLVSGIDSTLVLLLFTVTFLQLFFLTVGMVISLLMRKVRSVTPLSMGLAFGMYLLSAFEGMLGEDKLSYITPFKHFEANYIVANRTFNLPLVFISVALIIISVVGSYILYSRRNIYSV